MINPSDIIFKDSDSIKNRDTAFVEIIVDTKKVLESWKHSPFAHKWMDYDDGPLAISALDEKEQTKAQNILTAAKNGEAIAKPILGVGMTDYVEIGSGRAQFLTLSALGANEMPVYIPASNETFFKKFRASNSESGNVLFYILIAIAMLAALSFAVSSGNNTANKSISNERSKLAASEIMAYGDTLANAVGQLRLRGCTENEISFENSEISGYENPSAPSDETCHVFSVSGGGVNFETLSTDILDSSESASTFYGYWQFDATHCVENIGSHDDPCASNQAELVASVHYLRKTVCVAVNDLLEIDNPSGDPPIDTSNHSPRFTGTYGPSGQVLLGDDAAQLSGQRAGCYQDDNGYSEDAYIFYRVLVAR